MSSAETPTCPICLERPDSVAFADPCFHLYCFPCISHWIERSTLCPLCKGPIAALVHDIRGDEFSRTAVAAADEPAVRRLQIAWSEDLELRAEIYSAGLAVRGNPLADASSTDTVRARAAQDGLARISAKALASAAPASIKRIKKWIYRDVCAVLGRGALCDEAGVVAELVLSVLLKHDVGSRGAVDALVPFLGLHTNQFISELAAFALSPYDMATYDRLASYAAAAAAAAGVESSSESGTAPMLSDG